MKRVIFTGATSFLGMHVLRKLSGNGYEIYALVRATSIYKLKSLNLPNVRIYEGTLQDLREAFRDVDQADIFLHFAWDGSGDVGRTSVDVQHKNVEYSMEALNLANRLGCSQFVFPGSQAEYGICHEKIKENQEANPMSPYGRAKIEFANWAHDYCEERNIKFLHLRIFSVYGYGDRQGTLVDSCVKSFYSEKHISLGPCLQKLNYLYIEDFCEILLRMLHSNCLSGIYNIASEDTRILREYVYEIYTVLGEKGTVDFSNVVVKPEGVPDLDPDIDRIKNIIGDMKFTTFKQGISEILSQLEEESLL